MRIKNALRPAPLNKRKYSFGAIWGYPDPKTLPESYRIQTLGIKNQEADGAEDGCGAYAETVIREIQEGVKLDPAFTMAMAKEAGGEDYKEWGNSLDNIAKAAIAGFLEEGESPYTFVKDGRDFVANPANWGDVEREKAKRHETQNWFWIGESGKYDLFDCIRGALYKFKDEKRGAITGILWDSSWDKNIDTIVEGTSGHCIAIIGWDKDNLVIQNSMGQNFGDKGLNYFTRKSVNALFTFGVVYFKDMPQGETHETVIAKSLIFRSNWLIDLFNRLLSIFKR